MPLPQGRTTVINGTLNISNFSPEDIGPYQCKATNKLGSVTAVTTLHYVRRGKNQLYYGSIMDESVLYYETVILTSCYS